MKPSNVSAGSKLSSSTSSSLQEHVNRTATIPIAHGDKNFYNVMFFYLNIFDFAKLQAILVCTTIACHFFIKISKKDAAKFLFLCELLFVKISRVVRPSNKQKSPT